MINDNDRVTIYSGCADVEHWFNSYSLNAWHCGPNKGKMNEISYHSTDRDSMMAIFFVNRTVTGDLLVWPWAMKKPMHLVMYLYLEQLYYSRWHHSYSMHSRSFDCLMYLDLVQQPQNFYSTEKQNVISIKRYMNWMSKLRKILLVKNCKSEENSPVTWCWTNIWSWNILFTWIS